MDEPVTQRFVDQTEAIVRERMAGQAAGHGMDHVLAGAWVGSGDSG